MSLPVNVAEQILPRRFGEPTKPPTQYVIGFRSPTSRVLGLDREANEARNSITSDGRGLSALSRALLTREPRYVPRLFALVRD
jgi:hypothetical protein